MGVRREQSRHLKITRILTGIRLLLAQYLAEGRDSFTNLLLLCAIRGDSRPLVLSKKTARLAN